MKKRIAIIGAGITGLTLARALHEHAEVTVFEKARGVGGRMTTRYADPFYFDHGTQFFTARDPSFQHVVDLWVAEGLVARWTGKIITLDTDQKPTDRLWFEPHYVAVPNMNSLCKSMADNLKVLSSIEVAPLEEKANDGWHVRDKHGAALGFFDWVISTAPPTQTIKLFGPHLTQDEALHHARLLGCYTLMIGFNRPWKKSWIAAKIQNSPIEWVAINSAKPGRNSNVTSIVVHSSNAWAEEHIDDAMDAAELFLRGEFERVTKIDTRDAAYFSCHRWRYAIVDAPQAHQPFIDPTLGLASAGDWCAASRIEDAWLAAMQLTERVRKQL